MTTAFRCIAPIQGHDARTFHASQMCLTHRIIGAHLEPNPEVEVSKDNYVSIWKDFQRLNGEAPSSVTTYDQSYTYMANHVQDQVAMATRVEAFRWLPSFDVQDNAARNNKAWSLREGIIANLFPYLDNDLEAAITASSVNQDKFGISLVAAQQKLSVSITLVWKANVALGLQPSFQKQAYLNAVDFVEAVGNGFTKAVVVPTFGEMLYLHSQVQQEATGAMPVNLNRYAEDMLYVPKGYEEAEQEYQAAIKAQREAQTAAQQVEAQRLAQQAAARKEVTAKASKVALMGLAGIASMVVPSAEKRRKDKESFDAQLRRNEQAEYIRNRNENARRTAERNARRW
jgi:hypothetical protein